MKIGILTQPLHNNYGGLLQNYALQCVLKDMGHETETLDWEPMKDNLIKEWLWKKKNALVSLVQKGKDVQPYQLSKKEEALVGYYTRQFIDKHISLCDIKPFHPNDFYLIDKKKSNDAYIVGSDQVWRAKYNQGMIPTMFLDFSERQNVKRIAYAASFGTFEWEFTPQMTEECARLAKRFDLITVREKSGVNLCKEHLGVDATWVLDPTMLLNRDDYEKIVTQEHEPKSAGTLFHYILDPSEEKKALIEHAASVKGLQPFTIMPKCQAENRTKWDVKHRIEDCVFPSVTSWLRGFMDAEMVVVDSFHGAVFSIIFNKPFWVIGNKKRGNARFESLLGMFELEDRMIETGQEVDWKAPVDWERVNEIRQIERERCIELLKKSL